MNDQRAEQPHSAEYLSQESRDHWWNPDFLALMAQRWGLSGVRRVLDVGCGVGHWGQLLVPFCAPDATLSGVDREPAWVVKARERATSRGLGDRATYQQGTAEALPFPDGTFDLVTCQTVLLHVADPVAVLQEMKRVTAPSGLVAVAEPVNQASGLVLGSARFHEDVETTVALVRLELRCYRGKEKLGLGHNSIGALLPKLFHQAGLPQVQLWQNDKAVAIAPPYSSPEARAAVVEAKDSLARDRWIWDREETRRYYLAGGGAEADFDAEWARALDSTRRIVEAYEQGTEYSVGEGFFCLAAARKA